MMQQLQTFVFDEDEARPLRVVLRDGEPWFVAKDVCAILDIEQATRAVEPLDEDEKAAVSLTHRSSNDVQQDRSVLVISESGLYTLIVRSRQATTPGSMAHRFRRWVFSEVLPQIRKTGSYAPPDPTAGWDWAVIHDKIQLVRETRLTVGRKAAAELWTRLGLPTATPAEAPRTGALQGIDMVRQFLADCTVDDAGAQVQARHLHQAYAQWASREQVSPMTERSFAMCLEALEVRKRRGNYVHYVGIRLKHISEQLG